MCFAVLVNLILFLLLLLGTETVPWYTPTIFVRSVMVEELPPAAGSSREQI